MFNDKEDAQRSADFRLGSSVKLKCVWFLNGGLRRAAALQGKAVGWPSRDSQVFSSTTKDGRGRESYARLCLLSAFADSPFATSFRDCPAFGWRNSWTCSRARRSSGEDFFEGQEIVNQDRQADIGFGWREAAAGVATELAVFLQVVSLLKSTFFCPSFFCQHLPIHCGTDSKMRDRKMKTTNSEPL